MLFLYFVPSDLSCARVVCCVSSLFSDMITLREAEHVVSCLLKRFRQTFVEENVITLLMLLSYVPWGKVPMLWHNKENQAAHNVLCTAVSKRSHWPWNCRCNSIVSTSFLHCTKVHHFCPFWGYREWKFDLCSHLK